MKTVVVNLHPRIDSAYELTIYEGVTPLDSYTFTSEYLKDVTNVETIKNDLIKFLHKRGMEDISDVILNMEGK
jgi:hypothetical protein